MSEITLNKQLETKWAHHVPIINIFCDLLSKNPPGAQNLEKLLNVFSLVGALILAVILSVPASFSVEELENANKCFQDAVDRDDCWYATNPERRKFGAKMSDRLLFYYNMGSTLLSCSLFVTILVFTFLTTHDFAKDHISFVAWWKYIRYCILLSFILLLLGINWTYVTVMTLVDMKFPARCMVLESEKDMNYEHGSITPGFNDSYFNFQCGMVYGTIALTTVVLSFASWNMHR